MSNLFRAAEKINVHPQEVIDGDDLCCRLVGQEPIAVRVFEPDAPLEPGRGGEQFWVMFEGNLIRLYINFGLFHNVIIRHDEVFHNIRNIIMHFTMHVMNKYFVIHVIIMYFVIYVIIMHFTMHVIIKYFII